MAYTTVDNPELYFQTKLYTGNGGTQSITLDGSENMQPDWVWIKSRGDTSWHRSLDVVRGATKEMYQNETSAENTEANGLTSFDSDGFSIGSNSGYNGNTVNFASWNWKAGGSASSNSNGSITSTVSANTTAGFSIVSYTGTASAGATIGHGLGAVPSMYIIKNRSATEPWMVYHQSLGNTKALYLNATNAELTSSVYTNNTSPTSSVLSLGNWEGNNGSGNSLIAYCFAEKKGYSKFGSYTGNGNADGTFIYTGFRPAWLLLKQSSASGENWLVFDNKRLGYNVDNNSFNASANSAEATGDYLDLLSNGFKIRSTNSVINGSGSTYIYMAFAENPFVTSTGIPSCAR